jgi:hypothetical protein
MLPGACRAELSPASGGRATFRRAATSAGIPAVLRRVAVLMEAHPVREVLALPVAFRAKSFRLPTAAEPPFSEWPEKRGPKRGHPASAPCGHPVRKVRESGPGFSTGHPALAKRHRHPCRCPLRGLSTPPRRCRGAPGRAAGHRGPHFSEKLKAAAVRHPPHADVASFSNKWKSFSGGTFDRLLSTRCGHRGTGRML